jgi:hypothetical protein
MLCRTPLDHRPSPPGLFRSSSPAADLLALPGPEPLEEGEALMTASWSFRPIMSQG